MAELAELLKALRGFQEECPTLPKDGLNPHFRSKFTPLDTVVETIRPLLAKHGLTWSSMPTRDEHGPALTYVLGHADSGQTLTGTMPLLLSKSDPQGQGSAITYARRYAICAVLNLVADEDDDGNHATQQRTASLKAQEDLARSVYANVDNAKLSADRFEELMATAKSDEATLARFVTYLQGLRDPAEKPDTSYLKGQK